MDYLWTPWRYAYVTNAEKVSGCIFCDLPNTGDYAREDQGSEGSPLIRTSLRPVLRTVKDTKNLDAVSVVSASHLCLRAECVHQSETQTPHVCALPEQTSCCH